MPRPIDTRYEKPASESIPQYQERVKQYYTPTMPTTEAAPPVATPTVSSPIRRTIDTPTATPDPVDSFANTFRAPESREQIQERLRQGAQGVIDSLNKKYDSDVAEKRALGQERVNIDNATSIMSGLQGGTEARASRTKVLEANDKEIEAVNTERALALTKVYADISSQAETEAREQLADATRNADQIIARRKEAQGKAIENIKAMASAGLIDYDKLATSTDPRDQKNFQFALDAAGGEEGLRAVFMLNRPKDTIIGSPIRVGNKYIQQYQDPLTGKTKFEQMELPMDLPTEYNNFQVMGDNLVAIPDGWDGDTAKLKTVGSTLGSRDKQQARLLDLQIRKAEQDLNSANISTQVVEQSDGTKVLINSQTGAIISTYGGGASDSKTAMKDETLAIAQALREDAVGKGSAVGGSLAKMFPKLGEMGLQGNKTAYESRVETLKARLSFENLSLLKGAMSDKDLKFLQDIGSSLNTNMNEKQFNKELDTVIQKLGGASTAGSQIITAPDGQQIELVD